MQRFQGQEIPGTAYLGQEIPGTAYLIPDVRESLRHEFIPIELRRRSAFLTVADQRDQDLAQQLFRCADG